MTSVVAIARTARCGEVRDGALHTQSMGGHIQRAEPL